MWVYVLFAILLVFVIYKERQALGCPDWPDGTDCNNKCGKAVQGSQPDASMSNEQILDVIDHAAGYQNRWVKWRISFMIALFSTIIAIYVMDSRLPTEKELVVFFIVIMLVLTLSNNFYRFHLSDHVANHISEGVDILRKRMSRDLR